MTEYHSDQLICKCFDQPHFYWYSVDVLSEHFRERVRDIIEKESYPGSSLVVRFKDGEYVPYPTYSIALGSYVKYDEIILHRVEFLDND